MNNLLLASHPVEIFAALEVCFSGDIWLTWEPETLLLELREDVPENAVDKLLAVQAVASCGDVALRSSAAFEKVVNAFCNNICVMDTHQSPCMEEICYATAQIKKLLRMVYGRDPKFCGEVPGYVAAVAKYHGWFVLPGTLTFAQQMLDSLTNLTGNNKLMREHSPMVHSVKSLYQNVHPDDARKLLDDAAFPTLDNGPAATIIRNIVGALLFDPTTLYGTAH